jgi:hypothetical protein
LMRSGGRRRCPCARCNKPRAAREGSIFSQAASPRDSGGRHYPSRFGSLSIREIPISLVGDNPTQLGTARHTPLVASWPLPQRPQAGLRVRSYLQSCPHRKPLDQLPGEGSNGITFGIKADLAAEARATCDLR